MKICFIEDSSFMGGVQYSTFYLAEQIIKEYSVEIKILLPGKGPFLTMCHKYAIPYSLYNPVRYISTSIALFNDKIRVYNPFALIYNIYAILINSAIIIKKLKQQTQDLVVTKGLLNHFSTGIACKSLNLPVIWHLQDLVSDRYFGITNFIFNKMANRIPTHIICDGQIIKNSIKGSVRDRTNVVPNGIKTIDYKQCKKSRIEIRKEFGIPENAYVIGNLARITPWKGQEYLLNAFICYSSKNQDSYLLLVGSPLFDNNKYYMHLKTLIIENKLENRVFMLGYRTDLQDIFSAIDFFVYPSVEKDTSPLALLSALAAGLPVAVASIDSIQDTVSDCISIDLFSLEKRYDLVEQIKKYEDINLRLENGMNNQKFAVSNFDISIHTQQIIKLIRSIMDRR